LVNRHHTAGFFDHQWAKVRELAARQGREHEIVLYLAIKALPAEEQAELLALYRLGQSTRASCNLIVAAAKRQDSQYIAGPLAEKSNLAKFLNASLKRYYGSFVEKVKPQGVFSRVGFGEETVPQLDPTPSAPPGTRRPTFARESGNPNTPEPHDAAGAGLPARRPKHHK
jgi:hypothetical protein